MDKNLFIFKKKTRMAFDFKAWIKNDQEPTNDEIHCDELRSAQDCNLFLFVVQGVIGTFISTVGIAGNILSLTIIHKVNSNKKSATMFLLKCLAIVDSSTLLLYLAEVALPSIFNYLEYYDITNSGYLYFRWYVTFPFMRLTHTVSAWITCLLTVNR